MYIHEIPSKFMEVVDIPKLIDALIPCLFFADDLVLLAKTIKPDKVLATFSTP